MGVGGMGVSATGGGVDPEKVQAEIKRNNAAKEKCGFFIPTILWPNAILEILNI